MRLRRFWLVGVLVLGCGRSGLESDDETGIGGASGGVGGSVGGFGGADGGFGGSVGGFGGADGGFGGSVGGFGGADGGFGGSVGGFGGADGGFGGSIGGFGGGVGGFGGADGGFGGSVGGFGGGVGGFGGGVGGFGGSIGGFGGSVGGFGGSVGGFGGFGGSVGGFGGSVGGTGGSVGGFGGSVGGTGGSTGVCGDGKIGIGEQCDLGAANADRPAFELEWVFGKIGVRPLESKQSVQSFYGYSSASSHTGLEASGTSHMLLHRNVATGQLSLVMFHGIDLDATGQSQPASTVTFDIAGLPPSTFVTVVDDTLSEFNKSSGTTAFGNWQFSNNTDGGVLSGLPVPGSWEIPVSASFSPGIKTWFFDGITQTVTVSQGSAGKLILRAYATPAKCRTNCTIPKCGDGVLDGGEVCDDGNTIDGDGCSKACTSTP
ncbi:MAG: myxococcus cysteine-rich repeat containing protein [Polyangiaceae bacterium]